MTEILNLDAIKGATVVNTPFPYFVVENAIHQDQLKQLVDDFPALTQGGSFPLASLDLKAIYNDLAKEFSGPALRQVLAEKFTVDLTDRPVIVTARGYSRAKDGRIHTDSKTKLITLLLYLNEDWQEPTGNLRILNNGHDLDDYSREIPSKAGTLLVFKVTDNCWHGYPSFEGKRCSLQINYITSEAAASKHNQLHKLSAKLKALFKKTEGQKN